MWTKEALAELVEAKLKDYQRIATDFESELRQKDGEASSKILKDLEEIVKKVGDTEKYTLILEKSQSAILFGSQSADITDKIMALYNESNKKTAPAKK